MLPMNLPVFVWLWAHSVFSIPLVTGVDEPPLNEQHVSIPRCPQPPRNAFEFNLYPNSVIRLTGWYDDATSHLCTETFDHDYAPLAICDGQLQNDPSIDLKCAVDRLPDYSGDLRFYFTTPGKNYINLAINGLFRGGEHRFSAPVRSPFVGGVADGETVVAPVQVS